MPEIKEELTRTFTWERCADDNEELVLTHISASVLPDNDNCAEIMVDHDSTFNLDRDDIDAFIAILRRVQECL